MTQVLGATSTTDDVLLWTDLHGKRVLVTGGIRGYWRLRRARALAAHGAQVVGAARDLEKAEIATVAGAKAAAANGGSFKLVALDLASLKSVRACADELLARGEAFDVVIPMRSQATPFGHTVDGFGDAVGTNHLGHLYWSIALLR